MNTVLDHCEASGDFLVISTDETIAPAMRIFPHAEHCEALCAAMPREQAEALFYQAERLSGRSPSKTQTAEPEGGRHDFIADAVASAGDGARPQRGAPVAVNFIGGVEGNAAVSGGGPVSRPQALNVATSRNQARPDETSFGRHFEVQCPVCLSWNSGYRLNCTECNHHLPITE